MATGLNMVQLLKAGLEKEIKQAVTKEIIATEMADFEVRLKAIIKPLVERVTFDSVDSVRDMLSLRDELHVFLHWEDDKE